MNAKTALTLFVALASLCGCEDKTSTPSRPGAASASQKVQASAAPAGSEAPTQPAKANCAEGEWAEPSGAFCIKLPPGFKYKETKESDTGMGTPQKDLYFEGDPASGVSLSAYFRKTGKTDYEAGLSAPKTDAEQALKEKKGTGIEAEGDAPKGTGKYFVYVDVNKSHRCAARLLKGETYVAITFGSSPDKKLAPEQIESCKSAYAP